ncbi:bifunctional folylpolyglutamate synthase/dihydrofolate synthase [[Clostridium] innocuum]|nr:bifunctional folylpolyglutamate synthase/dihydrofolate synthase [[Clostridium] innocuum]
MRFQKAEDVIAIIEQRKNRGYGLDHFKQYMASLGNPQDRLRSIHIAGTNGKGSTTNDIRSILQAAGYKVGSFTSPFMITHLDRIRINNQDIREEAFLGITNRYYDSWMEWDLSMFEIDMCIAVFYYLEEQVDFCVFETGLGGRKDATNILQPLVSVITNIGMDHMEFLGDTLEKIAKEKAGIVKEGIDLITAEDKECCLQVFQKHTASAHAQCIKAGEISNIQETADGLSFDYGNLKDVALYGKARYQCRNAALAIEVCLYLQRQGHIRLTEVQLRTGLHQAVWIGRFETISKEPLIILDGAHNADGIHALCETLKQMEDVQVLFSVLKDKNFEAMLQELETVCGEILVVPFYNERALDVRLLEGRKHIHLMESYERAIPHALQKVKPLVITGSLYFISDVRKYLIEKGYAG